MAAFVYILRCGDGTLYTGWTNDPAHRLAMHNAGKGAKYTKSRLPVELVHLEEYNSKEEAMKREAALKKLPRKVKLELIAHGQSLIHC